MSDYPKNLPALLDDDTVHFWDCCFIRQAWNRCLRQPANNNETTKRVLNVIPSYEDSIIPYSSKGNVKEAKRIPAPQIAPNGQETKPSEVYKQQVVVDSTIPVATITTHLPVEKLAIHIATLSSEIKHSFFDKYVPLVSHFLTVIFSFDMKRLLIDVLITLRAWTKRLTTLAVFMRIPKPLPNRFLNCYMNSALQCLLATDEFVNVVVDNSHLRPISKEIATLKFKPSAEAIEFVGRRVMPDFGWMQCAHVLFLNLVNAINKESAPSWTPISDIFGVDVQYELRCEIGHSINTTNNHYLSLSLPLPAIEHVKGKCIDIKDCFQVLTTKKNVDFPCHCSKEKATHGAAVKKLSPILVIHFQRYLNGGKDSRDVHFGPEIVIPDSNLRYKVFGVVYHSGSLHGGHYWANVKTAQGWYDANDSTIRKIEGVRGEKPKCEGAYMLFCRRMN